MITHPETLLDWTIALTPIAISAAVALIGYGQYQTSKNKLRLDLYNRRYAIYEKCVALHQAYWDWTKDYGPTSKEHFANLERCSFDSLTAFRESQFLFGKNSDVYKQIEKFLEKINALIAYNRYSRCNDKSSGARSTLNVLAEKAKEVDLQNLLPPIEDALLCWLDFKKIEGK